jgi:hypothetical protein
MDQNLIWGVVGLVAALLLGIWLLRRRGSGSPSQAAAERLDTLIGWPPEPMRILRASEREALRVLGLALPGHTVLAQVPLARFINVPKRNSYAEWMRRVGSQCVDFVICDAMTQVIAVVDLRQPEAQMSERQRHRLARLDRTLKAAGIPLHIWREEAPPSVDVARVSILPHSHRPQTTSNNAFADTDPESVHDEIIELGDPRATTWYDDLDSGAGRLGPPER